MERMIEEASDPTTASDSASLSVKAGSLWRNTSSGDLFQCTSPAPGAAEWLKISDSSVSATELGYIDGVTAGTVTASKAVVVDSSKDVATLGVVTMGGALINAQSVTPAADNGAGSTILPGVTSVDVGAVTTDVNDWITLPSLSAVPVGHTIVIACNAGGAFEMRTPTTSGEKINTVDCDGTAEYLCTDAQVIYVTKVSDTDGWVASARTALGAVATAVIPD